MKDEYFENDFVQNLVRCSLMAVLLVVQKKQSSFEKFHFGKIDRNMTVKIFFHLHQVEERCQTKDDLGEDTHEVEVRKKK